MFYIGKGTVTNSISIRLLKFVLSIYFFLTLVMTSLHICIEYYYAKEDVGKVLKASEITFKDIIATDLWNMDNEQLEITVNSILAQPHVVGVNIYGQSGNELYSAGVVEKDINDNFGYGFDLYYGVSGDQEVIGKAEVFSNRSVVFDRIKAGIYTLIINALIKTTALVFLFIIVFNRLLTMPLKVLSDQASSIDPNNIDKSRISVSENSEDELGMLQKSLNGMMDKTSETIVELDALNKDLEGRVERRTSQLKSAVDDLNNERSALEEEVLVRKKSQDELAESISNLKLAQNQLVESEKMASLGGLVAGVAHEINTPVGLSLTGISHFEICVNNIEKKFREDDLEEDDFDRFITDSKDIAKTVHVSLERAANLVKSFKKVSVDQSQEDIREFNVVEYLKDTMISLNSTIKVRKVNFDISSKEESIMITSYPGSWAQIFTNLIQNTLIHGYDDEDSGCVDMSFEVHGDKVIFNFSDDGKGMTEETKKKIFDPFYTTNRGSGGTGLGMNIIYNLVCQKLQGKIDLESELGKGSKFSIVCPVSIA